jgi:predicted MFS family arabinose efflux permease
VTPPRPRRILPVIVLSQFTGTSLWFAGNALLPDLQRDLVLGEHAIASVTSAVQLGFIAGTLLFALLNLADRYSARGVFLASAICGATANAALLALPAFESPYGALLLLRFVTGFFLAGIYPVGMKIAASWYREGLGGALGYLVGALVLGTALPHLVRGIGDGLHWETVAVTLSVIAAAGGVLMYALVPDGPYLGRAARFEPAAIVRAFASPPFRASASGYFGHMWELYTLWAFVPVLLAGYASTHRRALDVSFWSFVIIGAGAIGCVGGGLLSRRSGSARVAFGQLSLSGACCLLSPLAFALPLPFFLAFMIFWGIVVVGDSPQFSALNAATAPREFVGSALTIVNCIGFSITVVSVQVTTLLAARLPIAAWFVPVAIGPALGLFALRRLVSRRHGGAAA